MFLRRVPALAALAVASLTFAQDDSIWINAGIQEAIANGQSSYVLPAGDFVLEKQIRIPAGTKNFALLGAGPDATVFRTPIVRMAQAIRVGNQPANHNNSVISGRPTWRVSNVGQNKKLVTLLVNQEPLVPGYYALWDDNKIRHIDEVYSLYNRTDIVRVTGYDHTTRVATLDVGTGRNYDKAPKLTHVEPIMCQNITVSGIGFDGLTSTGEGSDGLVVAGLTDGLNVSNVKVRNFHTGGIYTLVCRNVKIDRSDIERSTITGPGMGYGIWISRSRFVTITNAIARSHRHGYIMHAGAMDVTVLDSIGDNASFDSHGMDERRITFRRCRGETGLDLGNGGWLGGGNTFLVEDCFFTRGVRVHSNVTNVTVRRGEHAYLALYHRNEGTTGTPARGIPGAVTCTNVKFTGTQAGIIGSQVLRFQKATFTGCSFTNTSPENGRAFSISGEAHGQLQLKNCTFTAVSPRIPIHLSGGVGKLSVTIDGSRLVSEKGAPAGIWLSSPSNAAFTFTNNTFTSIGGKVGTKFLKNLDGLPVTDINNTVILK
jgi:hypothetical protein